jgi:transcriptional regulator with XRE-family HTH domain
MAFFAENLRKLRTDSGLKQSELAEKAGVAQAAVSQLEKGAREPTPAMIKKLANALGVNREELTGTETGLSKEGEVLMRSLVGASPNVLKQVATYAEFVKKEEKQNDD